MYLSKRHTSSKAFENHHFFGSESIKFGVQVKTPTGIYFDAVHYAVFYLVRLLKRKKLSLTHQFPAVIIVIKIVLSLNLRHE